MLGTLMTTFFRSKSNKKEEPPPETMSREELWAYLAVKFPFWTVEQIDAAVSK